MEGRKNKNSGENQMPAPKSTTARRLALLSGSSLSFAGLAAAASLSGALTPGTALAQAVCLAPPPTTGAGTNTVVYAAGTYNPGINCTASGGTMTVTTAGNITVSSSGGVPGARTPNGVNLTATGSDGVSFISAAEGAVVGGNVSAGSQVNGALIDVLTAGGDISIITGALSVSQGTLTHGILAQSTAGGDIAIDARNGVGLSTSSSGSASAIAAIDARTTTGSIVIDAGANVSGGVRATSIGIVTETDGAVTVNMVNGNLVGAFIAGRGTGYAMRSSGAGSVELNIDWTLPLGNSSNNSEAELRGLGGSLDFSGLTGGAVVNIGENATWEVSGLVDTVFGSGDDAVNIADRGYMFLRAMENGGTSEDSVLEDRYVIDFGGGDNRLTNDGVLLLGFDASANIFVEPPILISPNRYEGELVLENLTTFQNNGAIYMGARGLPLATDPFGARLIAGTDLWADDILVMQGAEFIGGEGSRLFLDVLFNATEQESCDASLRTVDEGDLAADCIDLRGGSVTGQTLVTFGDALFGDRGAYNPDGLVIVDVAGGTAEPDAFILDPTQPGYQTASGTAYYDKGLFAYVLAYDDADEQFKVYGVAAPIAQQYPLVATAAGELWRAAASSWLEQRQTGLPGADARSGIGGGVWMRVAGASMERDLTQTVAAGPTTLDFDNSYTQRNLTVTVGLDLAAGGMGGVNWEVGALVGYARSELEFDQSANIDNLEGAHAGAYGSLTAGPFFLDASLNGAWLTLDSDTPALNLIPAGTMVSGGISAIGAQAQAGWRLAAGPFAVEPLASVSYVTTTLDDLIVPPADPIRFGARVEFEDVTSLRAGAGVRLSVEDLAPDFAPTRLSLSAKAVNETDGAASASIVNVGPFDAPVSDVLEGTFGEFVGAVSVANGEGTTAGYLNLNGVFGGDYRSVGVSAGFRYQW